MAKVIKRNIEKRQILTKSFEKRFLIDPLTTNNAIYHDSLTFGFTIYNKTVNLYQGRAILKSDGQRNQILKNNKKKNRLNYLSRFMHFSSYIASKLNSQQTFLIFITSWKVEIVTLKTSLRRRLQCKNMSSFKTSSRRLQDVLVNVLQVLLKDVFKKLSCKHVFKTSWKTKKCYPEDVFNKYSTCLHQDDFAGLIVSFK